MKTRKTALVQGKVTDKKKRLVYWSYTMQAWVEVPARINNINNRMAPKDKLAWKRN